MQQNTGSKAGNTAAIISEQDLAEKIIMLEKEINELKEKIASENMKIKFEKISASEAQQEIEKCLAKFRKNSKYNVNILDIMHQTNLPPIQIEKIMKKLEQKGVREINGNPDHNSNR